MSHEMKLEIGAVSGQTTIRKTVTSTDSAHIGFEEIVPDGESDYNISLDLDISAVSALVLVSDQDVTVETNDTESPDDTINLIGDAPKVFNESPSLGENPFTTDVTDLYITNASGEEATIQFEAIYDSTP